MFIKEIKLFAPTEKAYDKFRQDLKSVFYGWKLISPGLQTIAGSKFADADDDDYYSARTSRDDLVSDFFKSILYLFGPRVRTVAPDIMELERLLEGGLRVLYPDRPANLGHDEIYQVSGKMNYLYMKTVWPDRTFTFSHGIGQVPVVLMCMDYDDGNGCKPAMEIGNRLPFTKHVDRLKRRNRIPTSPSEDTSQASIDLLSG